jgi:hypothetical protein
MAQEKGIKAFLKYSDRKNDESQRISKTWRGWINCADERASGCVANIRPVR